MGDKEPWADKVRQIEALFRFAAGLSARDGFDENLYREWHARDDRRASPQGPRPFSVAVQPDAPEMYLLAGANVRAQEEDATKLREKEHRREPELEAEAGAEAGC